MAATRPWYLLPPRSKTTASTPAAPRASAMDVYSGKAAQGIDNTGKNTVTRDALGNISVTNSFGVTTTTSPQGFSTTSRGMPAAPSIGAPEDNTNTKSQSGFSKGLSGLSGKISSGIKGLDSPQTRGAIAGAVLGGLLGGVPGAAAGANIGSKLGKSMGGKKQDTFSVDTFQGKMSFASPVAGLGFPDAPKAAKSTGTKSSGGSSKGGASISPGAQAAIDKGGGGLY